VLSVGGVLRDLSEEALVGAIEGNIVALYTALGAVPEILIEDGPDLLRCTSAVASPMFNCIARVRLTPDTAETALTAALDHFRARDVPLIFWWDGPACTPPDLGARLLARGFVRSWRDSPGMALDLAALPADPSLPPDFAIEPVGDAATLAEWGRTFDVVFDSPSWVSEAWVAATRLAGFAGAPWRCYLGRLGGEPVATALLLPGAGVAGLYMIGTIPAARRRGIGAAMTLAPLREARALGYRVGILHASPEGYALYQRLGFRQYCTMNRYLWVNPEARAVGSLGVYGGKSEGE
jgi:GNAT superfamily N-acetyltransferase